MTAINHEESQHCIYLMEWANKVQVPQGRTLGKILYHCPNGGKRSKIEAGIMKAEGTKAGQPDYHLPIASNGFASLYLEMKRSDADPSMVSKEQRERAIILMDCGNKVVFARNWPMAATLICNYLGMTGPFPVREEDVLWHERVLALVEKARHG